MWVVAVKQWVKYRPILIVHKVVITNKPLYISVLKTENFCRAGISCSVGVRLDETYSYRTDLGMNSLLMCTMQCQLTSGE